MQVVNLNSGMKKLSLGNSLTIKKAKTMKQNLFMIAAVAIAAVACNKELPGEQVPTGEVVTFEASVDGADTKVSLDGKVSKWENGDKITIHNGTKGYEFSTADAGAKANFTYAGNDFTGEKFMAVYPAGNYTADVEAKTVTGVVIPEKQVLVAGSFPKNSAFAVAYSETQSLSFKNAVALLKFKVSGDDITYGCFYADGGKGDLTGKYSVSYNEGNPILTTVEGKQWADFHMNDAVLSEDATYYLAVAPATFATGFGLSLNGVEVKKHTGAFTLERNHIYDLGTLEYKKVDPSTLRWGICGDMNSWSSDISMTLEGDWFVAKEVAVAAGQAFKFRANGSWDVNRGIPGDAEPVTVVAGEQKAVEHNGKNMTVAAGTYNIYLSKDCTKMKVEAVGGGSETPEVTPDMDSNWALAGTFNAWGNTVFKTTSISGLFVIKNLSLDSGDEIKVKVVANWNTSYGGGIKNLKQNSWMKVYSNGSNIPVSAAGKYDVYFDLSNARLYLMAAGTEYTTAVEQTSDGPAPASPSEWYIVGSFNNWNPKDAKYRMSDDGTYYVYDNFTATSGCEMKFAPGKWSNDKGASGSFSANTWLKTGGSNIKVTAGTYKIYLKKDLTQYKFEKK